MRLQTNVKTWAHSSRSSQMGNHENHCCKTSSTFTERFPWLCCSILPTAEMAFSVALMFSSDRDWGSLMTAVNCSMTPGGGKLTNRCNRGCRNILSDNCPMKTKMIHSIGEIWQNFGHDIASNEGKNSSGQSGYQSTFFTFLFKSCTHNIHIILINNVTLLPHIDQQPQSQRQTLQFLYVKEKETEKMLMVTPGIQRNSLEQAGAKSGPPYVPIMPKP